MENFEHPRIIVTLKAHFLYNFIKQKANIIFILVFLEIVDWNMFLVEAPSPQPSPKRRGAVGIERDG